MLDGYDVKKYFFLIYYFKSPIINPKIKPKIPNTTGGCNAAPIAIDMFK